MQPLKGQGEVETTLDASETDFGGQLVALPNKNGPLRLIFIFHIVNVMESVCVQICQNIDRSGDTYCLTVLLDCIQPFAFPIIEK